MGHACKVVLCLLEDELTLELSLVTLDYIKEKELERPISLPGYPQQYGTGLELQLIAVSLSLDLSLWEAEGVELDVQRTEIVLAARGFLTKQIRCQAEFHNLPGANLLNLHP